MTRQQLKHVDYVGDGVYAGWDGYQLWLFTSDGQTDGNFIALEEEVYAGLRRYVERLNRKIAEVNPA